MDFYRYHPDWKNFLGSGTTEGDDPIPGDATTIAPPSVAEGNVAFWGGSAWTEGTDYRGFYWGFVQPGMSGQWTDAATAPDWGTLTSPPSYDATTQYCTFDTGTDTWTVRAL